MQKILKNEKGSISLFILLAALFFLVVVTGVGVSLKNKEAEIDAHFEKTKASYEKDAEQVYNEKIRNLKARFKTGQEVNAKMKQLAGDEEISKFSINTSIKAIKRSKTIDDKNRNENNIVSDINSNIPIYMWFENGTIYFYTESDSIETNVDCSFMFCTLSEVTFIDIESFNTYYTKNMEGMFEFCGKLANIELSNFNTSNVENMSGMFGGYIPRIENPTSWSKQINMDLNEIDVKSFDTRKVTNMYGMFANCSNLKTIDLSNFDTCKVNNMGEMFNMPNDQTSQLKTIIFGEKWDTSNVTTMAYMFSDCASIEEIDFSRFNTEKVTDMKNLLGKCSNIETLDLSNFNTSNVTNMSRMFTSMSRLKTIYVGDGWNTNNVNESTYMFLNSPSIIGGNGTIYDTGKLDKEYARIDKEGQLGYLSYKAN